MGLLRSVLEAQRGTPLLFLVVSARVSLMPSIGHSSALRALFLFLRAEAFSVLFVQCLKMSILFVCGECPEFWSSFGTMPLNCLIPEFLVILLRLFNCFRFAFFFSCPAFPLAAAKPTTDRQCLILPLAFFFLSKTCNSNSGLCTTIYFKLNKYPMQLSYTWGMTGGFWQIASFAFSLAADPRGRGEALEPPRSPCTSWHCCGPVLTEGVNISPAWEDKP